MKTKPMTLAGLTAYLSACKTAIPPNAVMSCGHDAPDTDAVVSSIAEAYRRHLIDGTAAVPYIPADSLPAEIAYLLGDTLTPLVLCSTDVTEKLADPNTPYILTDHHDIKGRQVFAIVDHHLPDDPTVLNGIDAVIRAVGSSTTLVAQRCLADGLVPDAGMARILLGGILMDTEGLSPAKTRPDDRALAEWLSSLWDGDPAGLFADLRGQLLGETDLATLYRRDYRRFGDALGFAVIKAWDTTPIDEVALRDLLATDRQNSGVTATIAKITRYGQNGSWEETYFISASPADTHTITTAIVHAAGTLATVTAPDRVDLPHDAAHPSRKRLTPLLLPLLKKP